MDNQDKIGYVYIATNPSFRSDWVKIGCSSRVPTERMKELDNTSIPLPFDIYATMKTSKYKDVEKYIHNELDRYTDSRINKKREFFDIGPVKAYETLLDIANLIDDEAVVNGPDSDTILRESKIADGATEALKKASRSYKVMTDEVFYRKRGVCDAKMQVKDGNKFVVLEGSKIDMAVYSNEKHVKKIRRENSDKYVVDEDKRLAITINDVIFPSPSSACEFVQGGASNGKIDWKTNNGEPLGDFIIYDNIVKHASKRALLSNSGNKRRKPSLKFSQIGIKPGDKLVYINDPSVVATVVRDGVIEYNGQQSSLSDLAQRLMNRYPLRGTEYFTYNGEILTDRRDRLENNATL